MKISKKYFSEQGFITIPKATKIIIQKYNIMDRELEGKIYRAILGMAHNGEFKGRKYKHEDSRMWEISEEVIPYIEKQFNLIDKIMNKDDFVQIATEDESNTINVIKTLVNSCLKNRLTKEQCFDIIADLLVNNAESK